MEKAYRYRFYPTTEQEQILRRTIGCVRWVFNKALAARTEAWFQLQEWVDYVQTSAMLTQWKKVEDLQFLNEVSCVPLQQGLRHLQTAFTNFFAGRAKYPNNHSVKARQRGLGGLPHERLSSEGQLRKTRKGRKQKPKS